MKIIFLKCLTRRKFCSGSRFKQSRVIYDILLCCITISNTHYLKYKAVWKSGLKTVKGAILLNERQRHQHKRKSFN